MYHLSNREIEQQIKNLEKKIGAEKRKHAKMSKESDAKEETLKALEKEIEEYKETEQHLQQEYDELKKEGEVSLTEEQEAEYEGIREAAAAARKPPRRHPPSLAYLRCVARRGYKALPLAAQSAAARTTWTTRRSRANQHGSE